MTMKTPDILAIILELVILVGVLNGAVNRYQLKRSIGAQHIRYTAIIVSLPMAGALALQGMLTEAAVSVIMGALAYAFAGVAKGEE
jgi:hypothetical protein